MDEDTKSGPGRRAGMIALAGAVVLAAGAIGYRVLADGDATEAPAPAASGETESIEELRAKAEADPMDSTAWQELGFAYFQRAEYSQAARAYRQAIEGDSENAVLWSALGEARVMADERDPMPAEAVTAFEKAIALDPTDPRARYFLGVRKDLAGDTEGAMAEWFALLEDTPPGAPWEADLKRTIEQVGKINDMETAAKIAAADAKRPGAQLTATQAIPGPSRQQVAQASAIPPGEQRQMAEGMVERLEGRLASDPENVDGWVMLMRSRMTLGQPDRARTALARAIAANPGATARLRQEAQALGVPAG